MAGRPSCEVVVPTTGRPALGRLLAALAAQRGPGPPLRVVLVDDRGGRRAPLAEPLSGLDVRVVPGAARGPAAARNTGWRASGAEWVAFLDDDVVPPAVWLEALARDLAVCGPRVAASQGRICVPVPERPTDWERNVEGLSRARWATADMAYRRAALVDVGGFDERFPRAYREDADLGLRVTAAGWEIVSGEREILHPVGAAPRRISLAKQAGNADDVLMRALHGRGWRERAGVPRGRRPRHAVTASAGVLAVALACGGRRRAAAAVGAAWAAGVAELARARIAPGPRTRDEVITMLWTSALLPFAATGWWLRGRAGLSRTLRAPAPRPRPRAVLFDRDGTLVADVPFNGDPDRVSPVAGARAALERLRAEGVKTAVVSNQSGIARGRVTYAQVRAVNARVEQLLGPLGPVEYCPHGPADGCGCRKPAPGLVLRAAARLGVHPSRCAVVGDIAADVHAAAAAGARGVLVPTAATRPDELTAAPELAVDLAAAVALLLDGRAAGVPPPVALAATRCEEAVAA